MIGDTGTGKTYLVSQLVQLKEHVVILRTKPDDIKFAGFTRFQKARAMDDWHNDHILLDPKYEDQARQAWEMLERAWRQGGWTVVIDEQWYAEQELKMRQMIVRLLTQGRSLGITVVCGVQRPVEISRFMLSQSKHIFTFQIDGGDMDRVKQATTPRIVEAVESLTGHDFVYFNRSKKLIAKGNARTLNRIFV